MAMRVDVDGLDLLAVDGDGQGAHAGLRVRALEQAAAAENNSGRGSSAALEEVSARRHRHPSQDSAGVFAGTPASLALLGPRRNRRRRKARCDSAGRGAEPAVPAKADIT